MFGGWDLLASLCLLENTHKVGADVQYGSPFGTTEKLRKTTH